MCPRLRPPHARAGYIASSWWNSASFCGKFPSNTLTPATNTTYDLGCQAGANMTQPYLTAFVIDNAGTKNVSTRLAETLPVQSNLWRGCRSMRLLTCPLTRHGLTLHPPLLLLPLLTQVPRYYQLYTLVNDVP